MKTFLFITAILLAVASAEAQTPTAILVPYDTAKFSWTWTQGSGATAGTATEFRVKCGAVSKIYTLTKVIPDPAARTIPVSQVITAVGKYFCAMTAANQYGESGASNEVFFDAGRVPADATGFSVGN